MAAYYVGRELARAGLANDPDVILADEPTGELDGSTEQQVSSLLRERIGRAAGLLVVSHSADVVESAATVQSWPSASSHPARSRFRTAAQVTSCCRL